MLRARSGIRRLRPGASPLSLAQRGSLLCHPPPQLTAAALLLPGQQGRALGAAAAPAPAPGGTFAVWLAGRHRHLRRRLGTDPLSKISALVDYGSPLQVKIMNRLRVSRSSCSC